MTAPPPSARPAVIPVCTESIPEELKSLPQWVLWRHVWKNDDWAKVPFQTEGRATARVNDATTWGTFPAALGRYHRDDFDGIGFMFSAGQGFIGIDLDDCRDPEADTLSANAHRVLSLLASYAEVSPSGTGVKVWVKGSKPTGSKCQFKSPMPGIGKIEVYDANRFFCVTGHRLDEYPGDIRPAQEAVNHLLACDGNLEAPSPSRNGVADEPPASEWGKARSTRGASAEDRAARYLSSLPPAIQGEGGSRTTYWAARVVCYGFDLGVERGLQLLLQHYNPRCVPPWSEQELRHKCEDADSRPFSKPRGWLLSDDAGQRRAAASGANGQSEQRTQAGVEEANDQGGRASNAQLLVCLGRQAELWHDQNGRAYATLGRRTYGIEDAAFRAYLTNRIYQEHGRVAGRDAVASAINVLEAVALREGAEHDVFVRVGHHGEAVYLNLADSESTVIEIDAQGWRVCADPPVRFLQRRTVQPLPMPRRGGSLDDLRSVLNVDDDGWTLVKAWLAAAIMPRGPYPVLVLTGEQGSAKSTTAEFLKRLIDPAKPLLRAEPKDVQNLMIACPGNQIIAIDNVSRIFPWLSDALCRIATGAGYATRELYSDDQETVIEAARPVILNGITDFVTRPDLLERTITLNHPPIPPERRVPEAEIEERFAHLQPLILGALLDRVAGGLRELPSVKLESLPRMADFAMVGVAAERGADEQPAFLRIYAANQNATHDLALEADSVATAILRFMANRPSWEGTASELLGRIAPGTGEDRPRDWPRQPNQLSNRLRRTAPALRAMGIQYESYRENGSRADPTRRRLIRLINTDVGT